MRKLGSNRLAGGTYRALLRLYPKPFRERFGASMEQTFHDLLRERPGRAAGAFLDTSLAILKENLVQFTLANPIVRIAIATAALLSVPLVAMQFTDQVVWGGFDFIVAGVLLFGAGLTFELVSRRGLHVGYKSAVAIAVASGLLLIWINLAVGIIGNEGNPANLMYLGVLGVAVGGAMLARLQPRGMSRALYATALAQLVVAALALGLAGAHLIEHSNMVNTTVLNVLFAMLWAASGMLFQRAAEAGPAY